MSLRGIYQLLVKRLVTNRYLQSGLLLLFILIVLNLAGWLCLLAIVVLVLTVLVILNIKYYPTIFNQIKSLKPQKRIGAQKYPYHLLFSLGSNHIANLMHLADYSVLDTTFPHEEAEPITIWGNGNELMLAIDAQAKDKSAVLSCLQDWSGGKYVSSNKPKAIVMTVHLAELLLLSEDDIKQSLAEQRDLMTQCCVLFGYLLPVNLVVNGLSALSGYEQFKRRMSDDNVLTNLHLLLNGHRQVEEVYSEWHENIYAKLIALRVQLLSLENDPKQRFLIYDFPEQFYAIKTRMLLLLSILNKLYIDRQPLNLYSLQLLSTSKRKITITNQSLQEKPNFIKNAKQEVVITSDESYFDADEFVAIIHESYNERRLTVEYKKRQLIMLSFLATLGLLSILAFTTAVNHNYSTLTNRLQRIKSSANQLVSVLSSNGIIDNKVTSLLLAFNNYHNEAETIKTINHWFLLPGIRRIESYYRLLIEKTMQRLFFQPTQATLVKKLHHSSQQWSQASAASKTTLREQFYRQLAAYMILSFKRSQDIETIESYVAKLWADDLNRKSVTGNRYVATRLIPLIRFYLQQAKINKANIILSLPVKPGLVQRTRQQLKKQASLSNQYAYLLTAAKSNWPMVSLSKLLDFPVAASGQDIRFPSVFTQTAWQQAIKPSLNKISQLIDSVNWVMNMPMTLLATHSRVNVPNSNNDLLAHCQQKLRQLYFNDYRQAWLRLLGTFHLEKFHNIKQAQRSLESIVSGKSEFNRVFHKSLSNIAFSNIKQSVSNARQVAIVLKIFNNYQKKMAGLVTILDDKNIATLMTGNINDFRQDVTQINSEPLRHAVQYFLQQPYQQLYHVLLAGQRRQFQHYWQTIYDDYQRNINSQWPLANNQHKLNIESFQDFFQPGAGQFWQFFDKKLQPYLLYQNNHWEQKQWLNLSIGFSPRFMAAIEQLTLMRNALFVGDKLEVNFEVYPEPVKGTDELLLVINQQRLKFRNGPQIWQSFQWQPTNNNANTLLRIEHRDHFQSVIFHSDDAWGLLSLLQKAKITQLNPTTYRVSWKHHVQLLFRFQQRDNIISLIRAKQLHLPESLFS